MNPNFWRGRKQGKVALHVLVPSNFSIYNKHALSIPHHKAMVRGRFFFFFSFLIVLSLTDYRLLRVPSYVRRYRKRANGRKKSGSLSRRTASVVPGFTVEGQLPHATKPLSSSSSSASGRSEDAPQYGSLPGSDHQGQSQQDDSGPEGSPVYILTSAKGGPSYKLRDSR